MATQWKFAVNNADSDDPDDWGVFVSDATHEDYSDQMASDELSELMESLGWEEDAESYFVHESFTEAVRVLEEIGFIRDDDDDDDDEF